MSGSAPYILALYGLVFCLSVATNLILLLLLTQKRFRKNTLCTYLANLVCSQTIALLLGLPTFLGRLLLATWSFGAPLCYLGPILQAALNYVCLLSLLLLNLDRYRFLQNPRKARLPSRIGLALIWFLSTCVVVPIPVFVRYLSIDSAWSVVHHHIKQPLGAKQAASVRHYFDGSGLCITDGQNQNGNGLMQYNRILFGFVFLAPVLTCITLLIRSGSLLEERRLQADGTHQRPPRFTSSLMSSIAPNMKDEPSETPTPKFSSQLSPNSLTSNLKDTQQGDTHINALIKTINKCDLVMPVEEVDEEVDVQEQGQNQRWISLITASWFLGWTPITLLQLFVSPSNPLQSRDSKITDICYLLLVLWGYIANLSISVFICAWHIKLDQAGSKQVSANNQDNPRIILMEENGEQYSITAAAVNMI